ncbi:DASH complex subunit [Wickerhamomyces ciferrii]|uniref:DASH complex subunit SPC34 n=1 Tax=Wickerhamomyces ciferrii (strain ATCC 14091 / BCRC 22168 / CBS 111 / JCM 3599 / NBRC 0793 / NRRL Y-1031 F-60-10) TaxID=1206466 RepID=K0KJT0_WICCF|nr:DASH complex subunit [Wickerhamomyces ciferrii]CCH41358.1 DASH complex subunit [Wickerhamomyces ciferrii]
MSDLLRYLNSIDETSDSIKSLNFTPPGIFTNSLITKPNIVSLLRDADQYENSLYQVDPQGKPERLDGTLGVVDTLNDDFDHLEIQQQQQLNNELNDQDNNQISRKQAVIIPQRQNINKEKNDEDKGVKNLLKKFNETNQVDYDVDVLCETIRQLLEK